MKLLLIDGNSIMNRAYYGIRALTSKTGFPTNALTGFMNIYFKLLIEEKPDRIAVAFDLKAPTFRHKLYKEYKANRHAMPDDLAQQMPVIKKLLRSLGVSVVELEGYEADDIIGTLSHAAFEQGKDCVIMTGDRDSFQLVNDKVTVRLASNKEDIIYNPNKIFEVYGVKPAQMLDVKALMGDSSDNIPGVAGIGEKTALSLIQKYGSLNDLISKLAEIDVTKSVKTKLENGVDSAKLSYELGKICLTVSISTNLDDYKIHEPNNAEAVSILQSLDMNSAIKKLGLEKFRSSVKTEFKANNNTQNAAKRTVTKDNVPFREDALLVFIKDEKMSVFRGREPIVGDYKSVLENSEIKYTVDAKSVYKYCINEGIEIQNVIFDVTLASYLLDVNAKDYDVSRLCQERNIEFSDNEADISFLYLLCAMLWKEICDVGMLKVLQDIEIPLAEVLASMEHEGILLDLDSLKKFGDELTPKINEIEEKIYGLAGERFNIASPKQLSEILFEKLNLPHGKKKSTGYSTDSETLEALLGLHPIIQPILDYRRLTKLFNTYVKGLQNAVSEDGRMYTTFKQTETRTGRISSAEPNIQNIPVRTEIGREFRKFFIAAPGKRLIDADYSQIELRVLAALADDKAMIEVFREGRDIHAETAANVFKNLVGESENDLRRRAKAVNFGVVYGIGAFSLAKDIGVTVAEAKKYIDDYFAHYSGVKRFLDEITESAKSDGYSVTYFGRRRFIPEILSSNKVVNALGKRIAMNTPIQGTAADIIKIAMVKVYRRLKKELPEAKLILQVHDELIVEAPESASQKALEILREEMQGAVKLKVELPVDAKIGNSWYDTH